MVKSIEIGRPNSSGTTEEIRTAFAELAKSKLKEALGWSEDEHGLKHPKSKLYLNVFLKSSGSTPIVSWSGGNAKRYKYYNFNDNYLTSSYRWYWDILYGNGGAMALKLRIMVASNGATVDQGSYMIVIAQNTEGMWNVIMGSGTILSVADETLPNFTNINTYVSSNSVYPLALTKMPDLLHASVYEGLYYPLYAPVSSYSGVYELNKKHYQNVCGFSFALAMALD